MIKVLIGDMFRSEAQTLVNTVNCVGVMGKGVALEFKKRWPGLMKDYEKRCSQKLVEPGVPYLYTDMIGTSIVNFPTKGHWKSASKLSDIEKGLGVFASRYKEWGITSIAFPPLGCGNGGLEWEIVGPVMYRALSKLDIPIEIYAPFGTPTGQLSTNFLNPNQAKLFDEEDYKGSKNQKLNPNWIVLLEVLHNLESKPYVNQVGRTIFQSICYAVTALGVDTELEFKKSNQGPLSDQIQKLLGTLANANLLIESQSGRKNILKTGPEYLNARAKSKKLLDINKKKIAKAVDLFSRIKNTEQAEEATTIFQAVRELKKNNSGCTVTEREILDSVLERKKSWSVEGKRESVAISVRNLVSLGWIGVSRNDYLVLENSKTHI